MAVTLGYHAFLGVLLAAELYWAAADSLFPFLPPFSGSNVHERVCPENVCGRGTCVASNSSIVGFACRCDRGWIQPFDDGPCVIPNCTMNIDCANSPAPGPAQAHNNRTNSSIFDPCSWTDCGQGTCNATSLFTHTCDCDEGYHNLFNSSAFPCYRECSFGVGCENLGFNITNSSNRSPPPPSPTSNALGLVPRTMLGWLITLELASASFLLVIYS